MKRILSIAALALMSGCLAPAPKAPVTWNLDADTTLKVATVTVCSPYDGTRFVVLRPDGSVVFDAYNCFSARPAALVRAACAVVPEGPELVVRRLALDCRKEGQRLALVELQLRTPDKSLGRAEASVPTDDGDYTKAFGTALSKAAAELSANITVR